MTTVIGALLQKKYKQELRDDDPSRADEYKNGCVVSYALGGVLLGATVLGAVIVALTQRKKRRAASAPRLSCGLGACQLTLRF